ncbi:hypothetical protein AOQ84DRAFT_123532 [Glonium stellatum]|uniref:Uncharacterized protein n=1 Tax=Glonium stellatum TaxID=574774 RepID=A0A8E2JNX9_9PEZI|nr:hypothetical protein AOQ84DRAFT_123532 [Glonium stellatum]
MRTWDHNIKAFLYPGRLLLNTRSLSPPRRGRQPGRKAAGHDDRPGKGSRVTGQGTRDTGNGRRETGVG